jgi:hypothetical protein
MEQWLSLLGLLATSISGIWLLAHEIRERHRKGDRLQKLQDLRKTEDALRRSLEQVTKNLQTANDALDPTGEHVRYPLEQWTATSRAQLAEAQHKVTAAENALQDSAAATWPQPVHILAFVLLGFGFVCQLLAELIKMFGTP